MFKKRPVSRMRARHEALARDILQIHSDFFTAESVNGAYKTELVWRHKPFADLADLELATFRWVS